MVKNHQPATGSSECRELHIHSQLLDEPTWLRRDRSRSCEVTTWNNMGDWSQNIYSLISGELVDISDQWVSLPFCPDPMVNWLPLIPTIDDSMDDQFYECCAGKPVVAGRNEDGETVAVVAGRRTWKSRRGAYRPQLTLKHGWFYLILSHLYICVYVCIIL